jgi:hypothetical protein
MRSTQIKSKFDIVEVCNGCVTGNAYDEKFKILYKMYFRKKIRKLCLVEKGRVTCWRGFVGWHMTPTTRRGHKGHSNRMKMRKKEKKWRVHEAHAFAAR